MAKIATEKYWFNLIGRTDYPHGGGGEYCPTKENILTVKRYGNYALDETSLKSYTNNQLVQEPDIIYNTLVDRHLSVTWFPLENCPDFALQRIVYIIYELIFSDGTTYSNHLESWNCGTSEAASYIGTILLSPNVTLISARFYVTFNIDIETTWQNAYIIAPVSNGWNILLNNPDSSGGGGTSTSWQAYVRVPTSGCTGIINYDMTVYYSWNEADGTFHDAVRTDSSGTLIADGSTRYIMLGNGTFTPGENYWYSGSFRSACTTFNFSVHVDGTSSDGRYYS